MKGNAQENPRYLLVCCWFLYNTYIIFNFIKISFSRIYSRTLTLSKVSVHFEMTSYWKTFRASQSLKAKTQIGELSDSRTIDSKSRGNNESRIETNLLEIIHGLSRRKRKPRRKLRPSRLLKIAAGLSSVGFLRLDFSSRVRWLLSSSNEGNFASKKRIALSTFIFSILTAFLLGKLSLVSISSQLGLLCPLKTV